MKNILLYSVVALCILMLGACDSVDDLVTENAVTGGLVNVETPLLSYVIGDNADYNVSLQVLQGEVKTTAVNVLKQFTGTVGGEQLTSNEVLMKTIDIASTTTSSVAFSTNFAELREGLTLNGEALPTDDLDLTIGDFWTISFQAVTSEGNNHRNLGTTKIAVATRLAGVYTIAQGHYIHPSTAPNVTSDYSGSYSRIIESIDPITYRMSDIGPWEGEPDNFFYFQVDENNNVIILKEWEGATQLIWGADELANCADNPTELPDVSCNNDVELSDDGHDIIRMSYGYIRSSGTRQFDDIMVKQ